MRQSIGLTALADAKPKQLIQVLAPVFQQLMDGEKAP